MGKSIISQLETIANTEETNQASLARYILAYEGDLNKVKVSTVCEEIFVSPATASRLAKRLNMSSFNELRFYVLEEKQRQAKVNKHYTDITMQKYYADIKYSLANTFNELDEDLIKEVAKVIHGARKIDFYGVGGSNVVLQDFAYKIARLKKSVTVHADTHLQYVEAMNSDEECVAIGLSYSGVTREVINALDISKVNGSKTVLLSHNKEAAEQYDYPIYIESTEQDIRTYSISSRLASLAILDLIYLKLIMIDPEYYKGILEANRMRK